MDYKKLAKIADANKRNLLKRSQFVRRKISDSLSSEELAQKYWDLFEIWATADTSEPIWTSEGESPLEVDELYSAHDRVEDTILDLAIVCENSGVNDSRGIESLARANGVDLDQLSERTRRSVKGQFLEILRSIVPDAKTIKFLNNGIRVMEPTISYETASDLKEALGGNVRVWGSKYSTATGPNKKDYGANGGGFTIAPGLGRWFVNSFKDVD